MYNLQKDLERARMDSHATAFAYAMRKWEDFQTVGAAIELESSISLWRQAKQRMEALEMLEAVDPSYIDMLNQVEQTLQAEQHQASEDE